jgi:two-component system, NtrC family, response regulator AtoC
VMRVGSVRPEAIDVRFVAATNRSLEADVAAGRFRADLYFRLAGFTARIPPLREREDEIVPIAEELARRFARELGLPATPPLGPDAAALLRARAWPGNIRELRNVIERAVALCDGRPIGAAHVEDGPLAAPRPALDTVTGPAGPGASATSAERDRLIAALTRASGNQSIAARELGMSRSTLLKRLDALGIARPRKRPRF